MWEPEGSRYSEVFLDTHSESCFRVNSCQQFGAGAHDNGDVSELNHIDADPLDDAGSSRPHGEHIRVTKCARAYLLGP